MARVQKNRCLGTLPKNQREILKTVACTLSRNIAFGSVILACLGNNSIVENAIYRPILNYFLKIVIHFLSNFWPQTVTKIIAWPWQWRKNEVKILKTVACALGRNMGLWRYQDIIILPISPRIARGYLNNSPWVTKKGQKY